MTSQKLILDETHRNARRMVKVNVPFGSELYTNNQNLQVLVFFELFRQTAYEMISDGGPHLAIELMEKVIEEMREVKKARRGRTFDRDSFRKLQDHKRDLEQWEYFMDIPFASEVPDEEDEEVRCVGSRALAWSPRKAVMKIVIKPI